MNNTLPIRLIQTARDTNDRLTETEIPAVPYAPVNTLPVLLIDPGNRFQEIVGFGGAFTEAGADTLNKLSPAKRAEILRAYFHTEQGIGYTLCRTHINSCDFSLGNYACDEVEGDVDLTHFSIDRDRQALIPFIREAGMVDGASFKLYASPWSPPAWMKTNGEMNNWTAGWTDWNMVLNEHGGPNHVGNYCDAPIIADTQTDTIHYQNAYYYLGHFSKFIRPGAIRISCESPLPVLETTAFQNADDSCLCGNEPDGRPGRVFA